MHWAAGCARAPRQGLQRRFARWALARHGADSTTLLGQRNVYILPTRAGWFFALTLLVLLAGSINYQLNLGYLFTFALAGSALMSMHVTHANLRGLELSLPAHEAIECFAARPGSLRLRLRSTGGSHWGLLASIDGGAPRAADLQPGQAVDLALPWLPPRRGHLRWPTLQLESRYPFGLWRAWSVWRPPTRLWVYPTPRGDGQPLPQPRPLPGDGSARSRHDAGDEADELRAWREGDSARRIVWRKSRPAHWIVRSAGQAPARARLCLDWEALARADSEARLQQLCAWVLQARQAGLAWEMRLPGQALAGSGEAHARRCLQLLAGWGLGDETGEETRHAH